MLRETLQDACQRGWSDKSAMIPRVAARATRRRDGALSTAATLRFVASRQHGRSLRDVVHAAGPGARLW
jgi:hypothetical protein